MIAEQTESFALQIPALKPGTVAYEVAEDTSELETTYFHVVEPALRHGSRADVEAAERAFAYAHEKVCIAAFIRLRRRRASLRPARSSPRRPRCAARGPRPRTHRRRGGGRGGGGRGGPGDDGGGASDDDPARGNGSEDANERHP